MTPVTEDKKKLSSFSDNLMDYVSHYIVNVINPLFNSSTSSVRAFFNQMNTDTPDTIALAGETKALTKVNSDDFIKVGIGIALALGAFSLLRR